jgi:hypothetical protein
MSWDKLIEQNPNKECRERVLQGAARELAKLDSQPAGWGWNRRWLLSGIAAAVAAVFLRYRLSSEKREAGLAVAELDHEMLENAEMLKHLEMMQDLDILEHWNGEGA